jgi:WD40 repeat protein
MSDPNATTLEAGSVPTSDQGAPEERRFPIIPGYEILEEIGRGAMGVVYKAVQTSAKRTVALKMILSGIVATREELTRFRTEAEAVARLQHPNIVQVFDVGEYDGRPFFSLEFVTGGTLKAKVRESLPDPMNAAGLVEQIARGMHAVHQVDIVHRDLKPANVLLAADGTPKIADFGLAKKLDEDAGQTRPGAVMGTPSYMAPEQARGETASVTALADVYALGAILYEMLTGRPPFKAATIHETLRQVIEEEPVPPRSLNPAAPRDLETICLKCLHKEPSRRYATARDLADDLRHFLNGEPIMARPVGQLERTTKWVKRNPVVAGLLTAIVVSLVAGATVGYVNYRDAREQEGIAHNETGEAREQTRIAKENEDRADREKKDALHQLRRLEWSGYAGKLLLAQAAYAEGNMFEARRYLDECQEELRGWEHRHLRSHFDSSKQTLRGHIHPVSSVSFSPDGQRILTGSGDSTAKVWDADKGTELLTLKGHNNLVTSVDFSPDGKRILTGSQPSAKVWDADKGTELLTLEGHTEILTSVRFSPDGKRILTGSWDNTAKVWDADKGTLLLTLTGHTGPVYSVSFSPDGQRILTGGWDKTAKVWDAEKGTELLTLKGHTQYVLSVSFSPDGQRILTGSWDGTAKVWDAEKGTDLLTLKGHTGAVRSVSFSLDGQLILTGSEDSTAKVWDADKGTSLLTLKGHTYGVNSVSFSPDGKRILTGSNDGTAKVWDADKDPELLTLKGHTDRVTSVSFSPDGQRILTGSADCTAKVWDADKGTELLTLEGHTPLLEGHTRNVTSVSFSPDGKRILTGSDDKTAKVWDADKGTELLTLKGHTRDVSSVSFSPDGKRILTGSNDKTAKVWDADKGTELLTLKGHSRVVTSVSFSPDGQRILTGSNDGTAKVWDAEKGTELLTLKGHTSPVYSVSFSLDGQRILTGSADKTAKVWDAEKGTKLLNLKGHTNWMTSLSFSPDGKTAFAWGMRGNDLTWHAATGQPVAPNDPPKRPEAIPATSPDGRLSAKPVANDILVGDRLNPVGDPWPLPDAAERKRYHSAKAIEAEREKQGSPWRSTSAGCCSTIPTTPT